MEKLLAVMGKNECERQWGFVLMLTLCLACLVISGRPKLDACESERDCSIRLSNSTSLQCIVGHSKECDNIKPTRHATIQGARELYPYLATIAIYKKPYRDDHEFEFHVNALNFSFIVPQTEINDNGVIGVRAKFKEASGYNNNSHYKEPICRLFNLSGSPLHLLDTFGVQEIPYSCIGINIIPSVFQLSLMSIPSSHCLNYVVSWHQPPHDEFEYIYNFYEEPSDVIQKSVWVEQLIAVAVVEQQRLIHAVFQLPKSNSGVTFFNVSLVKGSQTIVYKQVGPRETSVTFTDVPPGQYRVVVQPQGGVCDTDLTLCAEIVSEHVNISRHSDTALGSSTNDTLVIVISVCAVVIILTLGIWVLLITKKHWKKGELESSEIHITSLACRELEKDVTSYFCSFLSVAFQTSVTFTFPLLHPGKIKIINAIESHAEVGPEQNLLQSSHIETCCSCIVLQFSYSGGHTQMENSTSESVGKLLKNSSYFKKRNLNAVEDILKHIRSKQAYLVTFKQDSVSPDVGIAYTIYEGSINSLNSEDEITVLNSTFRKPSCTDTTSQRTASLTYRFYEYNQHVKEYCLPSDIHDLFEDLRSSLHSKVTPDSEISKIEYWHLAVTVFHKANEHSPDHTTMGHTCGHGVDESAHKQAILESDYIHNNQKASHHLLDYTRQLCSVPGFSASANQIHTCHSESSLIAPLRVVEDLFYNSVWSENKKLHEMLQGNDEVRTFKSPYNQKHMLLKSIPIIRPGSVCSCDSYSNLTEAENDMEQQSSISQHINESNIKQAAEQLVNEQYSCICPFVETFSSRSNTLTVATSQSKESAS